MKGRQRPASAPRTGHRGAALARPHDRLWLVKTSTGEPFEAGSQAGPQDGGAWGGTGTKGHCKHLGAPLCPDPHSTVGTGKLQLAPRACSVFLSGPAGHPRGDT